MVAGILVLIGIAFAVDAGTDIEQNAQMDSVDGTVAGAGDRAAVRYLDGKGITIEPELYSKIAEIVCDGMDRGNTGQQLTPVVKEGLGGGEGLSTADASALVASSVVYTCPTHIDKLSR